MAQIVRLPSKQTIAALCVRLRHLETAESPDETTMATIVDAQHDILTALAGLRSSNLAEVSQKLAAVARRADAADGILPEGELNLLRSALRDISRIEGAAALGAEPAKLAADAQAQAALL